MIYIGIMVVVFVVTFAVVFDWSTFYELKKLRQARGSDWTFLMALGLKKDHGEED